MKSEEYLESLHQYAINYILECMQNTKEAVSGSGKVVSILDRHIPTIDYFLNIWLPLKNLESIHRATYYNWLKSENHPKQKTIKQIDDLFKSLAIDIVANEGKGIFYAKNRLSMTDKQQLDGNINFKADFGTN